MTDLSALRRRVCSAACFVIGHAGHIDGDERYLWLTCHRCGKHVSKFVRPSVEARERAAARIAALPDERSAG